MRIATHGTFALALLLCTSSAGAADIGNDVQSATRRGLALVTKAGSNWHLHKTCFSCHHQTLPMLTMLEAQRTGAPVDKAWLKTQADATLSYFTARIGDMDEGTHVPGGAATVAYGLWALSLDQRPPDKTTTAMVTYLLKIQGVVRLKDRRPSGLAKITDGRWIASCRRAPMQGSEIGDTVLVLMGMEKYASPEQQAEVAKACAAADRWLSQAPFKNHQDRLWRLWGLHHRGGSAASIQTVRAGIVAAQRKDGGWGETEERETDAYSTGQTLFMLLRTGMSASDPAVVRARDYLLKQQLADGSWLVESHQKFKAQPYFENGDPHGEHQFISTAATCWATAALAQLTP